MISSQSITQSSIYLDFLKEFLFGPLTSVSDIHSVLLKNLSANRINRIADQHLLDVAHHDDDLYRWI